MRAVFALVLLVGMGLAGFAVYMVKGYMDQQTNALQQVRAQAQQTVETVQIYAPTTQLRYGQEITPDDVALIHYAKASLPEGVFTTEEELFPEGPDVLRLALRSIEVNEPLLASKVTAPGEQVGITTRLEQGMRAFTIRVDVSSGVSGFLRPGDRVDIYWTGSVNNNRMTQLIRSRVPLIAVDQSADTERANASVARTVTVQVSPEDVAFLTQAQSTGALTLSLLGVGDDTIVSNIEVDQRMLLGLPEPRQAAPAPAPEAPPETCSIRQRRGAEVVNIPIPCRD
jgi:pilus assembly protein CpaB